MKTLPALIAAALAASPALALEAPQRPSPQPEREARIPFVGFNAIRTFRPVSDEIVYLQDQRRNWYRATLAVPCLNIQSALRLGVDTRYGSTLDNTSSFIVDGESCRIHSLVRSEAPPPRRGRRDRD